VTVPIIVGGQHNGAHRFLVVKIKGGKPTLETFLEETTR